MTPSRDHLDRRIDVSQLIEVWKVLEALTVSLDRIGAYWRIRGEIPAQEALNAYLNPDMFKRIAGARSIISTMIENIDPALGKELDRLAEDGTSIGYWQGGE